MRREELDYGLPPELIAQRPAEPRDAARLLVLHRDTGAIQHRRFRDLVEYLRPGDCVVRNVTRVIPARFFCRRATGGRIEALYLRDDGPATPHALAGATLRGPAPGQAAEPIAGQAAETRWRVLLRPSARLRPGERLAIEGAETGLRLIAMHERGEWTVAPEPGVAALDLLDRVGRVPLPPYIHRPEPDASAATAGPRSGREAPDDRDRYQTVYAAAPGAVAAPTAGLHFTPELLGELVSGGVILADVTLHVGVGTFAPITAERLAEHVMHAEWYEISASAAETINAAGGRLVAVGSTSLRVLETLGPGPVRASRGWTDLFIYPPYTFRRTGALLTNFHLPGSTLLALVMAFAGIEHAGRAYAAAIAERYRFYSYGDAMLIV